MSDVIFEYSAETDECASSLLQIPISQEETKQVLTQTVLDVPARIKTIIALSEYQSDQTCLQLLADLLLPMIYDHPRCRVHAHIAWQEKGRLYEVLSEAWKKMEIEFPRNAAVHLNSGKFHSFLNQELAEHLWLKAEECEVAIEDSALALSDLYYFGSVATGDAKLIETSASFLSQAIERHKNQPTSPRLDVYQEMLLERIAKQSIEVGNSKAAVVCANYLKSLNPSTELEKDCDGIVVSIIRHKYAGHKAESFLGLAQLLDAKEAEAVETFKRMSGEPIPDQLNLSFTEKMVKIDNELALTFLEQCHKALTVRLRNYRALKDLPPKELGYVSWARKQNICDETIGQNLAKPLETSLLAIERLIAGAGGAL